MGTWISVSCLHTVFLSVSSWKDTPAFVAGLLRDVLQSAVAVTSSGMDRSGLAPDPNIIVSQMTQSRLKLLHPLGCWA